MSRHRAIPSTCRHSTTQFHVVSICAMRQYMHTDNTLTWKTYFLWHWYIALNLIFIKFLYSIDTSTCYLKRKRRWFWAVSLVWYHQHGDHYGGYIVSLLCLPYGMVGTAHASKHLNPWSFHQIFQQLKTILFILLWSKYSFYV